MIKKLGTIRLVKSYKTEKLTKKLTFLFVLLQR